MRTLIKKLIVETTAQSLLEATLLLTVGVVALIGIAAGLGADVKGLLEAIWEILFGKEGPCGGANPGGMFRTDCKEAPLFGASWGK